MRDWTLEADEVLALPLDELALMVLQDTDANREWNWQNWLNSTRHGYGRSALRHLGPEGRGDGHDGTLRGRHRCVQEPEQPPDREVR